MDGGPPRALPHELPRSSFVETMPARCATADRDGAEQLVTDLYLPNWLDLRNDPAPLQMEFSGLQVGSLTAGLLSHGRAVGVRTADAQNFHVDAPVRGRVAASTGSHEPVATRPGRALVFSPGAPAHITWSVDSEQLCTRRWCSPGPTTRRR